MLRYIKANMGEGTDTLTRAMKLAQTPRSHTGNLIGLAWEQQSSKRGDVVWHNGGTAGYSAYVGFTADGRRGVVLSNTASSVTEPGFQYLASDTS